MEAASKLKGANLDSTTFSTEGDYSGGFKNGKKHGFGYVNAEKYYSNQGWGACTEYKKSFQVHIDGKLI